MLGNNANLLYGILITSGHRSAVELCARTKLSQPAVSRALSEIAKITGRLVTHRNGRSIVYAIAKQIRSLPAVVSIHQITREGNSSDALFGTLTALEGGGYIFIGNDNRSELFEGLPWFLQDMRPQGYIGRAFCHAYSDKLGLSNSLSEWSDDDVIYALSMLGEDSPGNLIVGNVAWQRFLTSNHEIPLSSEGQIDYYDSIADAVVHGGVPGSSAAGEHPKFLARYIEADNVRNVIVKFSPLLEESTVAVRWKDLLIAEHLALETLKANGLDVPQTRIIISGKRCYFESERFDRVGLKGRIGTVSFDAIDNAFIGSRRTWAASATVLRSNAMIDRDCEEQIRLVELFGRCIANTDMHFGNLSFYWDAPTSRSVRFTLAPLYDMLPMLYAPEKSEVVHRVFNLPSGTEYGKAGELAYSFWNRVSSHENVSNAFKEIAIANAGLLSRALS